MLDYQFLGSRIRAIRLEKKITQEKLAEAAGVGVTHISHIETGKSIPSLQTLVDISNALGCSADELLCIHLYHPHKSEFILPFLSSTSHPTPPDFL